MRVEAWGKSDRDKRLVTEANKPGTPGRSRSSRKTIAQGVPGDFGGPVLSLRAFVFFGTRGSGCVVHPAFPAPSVFRGPPIARLGREIAPREYEGLPKLRRAPE